jgi:hypothetical protein
LKNVLNVAQVFVHLAQKFDRLLIGLQASICSLSRARHILCGRHCWQSFETDFLTDGVGQTIERSAMLGKNAAVLQENLLDPCKTLIGFPPQLGQLPIGFRGSGEERRLILNQRCQCIFQPAIGPVPWSRHHFSPH